MAKTIRNQVSVQRPPGSKIALPPELTVPEAGAAAGGPQTRGLSTLGRMLADLLAYFEVRTVSTREIELVRPTHRNGWLRPEIEAKLASLHPECPDHQELRRLVLLSLDLLTAVDHGTFDPGPAWAQVEPRLLRALAYFVRDGDAIPDHLPHGFDDDMREFQELAEKASVLLAAFEVTAPGQPPRQPPDHATR
jgi:hypothetical protein